MSAKIKLVRLGRKKRPFFRIVVSETRDKLRGKVVETLGFYDPEANPEKIEINKDALKKWLTFGVQPTASVRKLLKI